MSAYGDVIARLFAARRFGVVLGLDRMHALLARLGDPQHHLGTVVHVAGTNGKGSTVAMLAALARAAGLRVGVYTSPHLVTVRERIVCDGQPVSEAGFVAAARAVASAGGDDMTFFEQLTAMALHVFAEARPDVTILEVGLGGRLDATNAVHTHVGVVTTIALDHQAVLGDTLEAIAGEKAGIFEPGQRIVIGERGEPAASVLRAAAAIGTIREVEPLDDALVVGLRGAHQRHNAAVALTAMRTVAELRGLTLDAASIAAALAGVTHPGRFERVAEAPTVVLDGAHNPHAAAAIAAEMRTLARLRILVLAVARDKDAVGIAEILAPLADHVVTTEFPGDRSLPAAALGAIVEEVAPGVAWQAIPDLAAALAHARRAAGTGGAVLVTGSLMLIGAARAELLGLVGAPLALRAPAASEAH